MLKGTLSALHGEYSASSKHWFTTSSLPLEDGAGKRCSECEYTVHGWLQDRNFRVVVLPVVKGLQLATALQHPENTLNTLKRLSGGGVVSCLRPSACCIFTTPGEYTQHFGTKETFGWWRRQLFKAIGLLHLYNTWRIHLTLWHERDFRVVASSVV